MDCTTLKKEMVKLKETYTNKRKETGESHYHICLACKRCMCMVELTKREMAKSKKILASTKVRKLWRATNTHFLN